MDIDRTATGIYESTSTARTIPYCYYSPTWECPYPPAENRLKVPVRAGERMKKSTKLIVKAIVFDFDGVISEQRAAAFPLLP